MKYAIKSEYREVINTDVHELNEEPANHLLHLYDKIKPIEKGKVYKFDNGALVYVTDPEKGRGFGFRPSGSWNSGYIWNFNEPEYWTLQEDLTEWKEKLEAEAERRGYKHNPPNYKCLHAPEDNIEGSYFKYSYFNNKVWVYLGAGNSNLLMENGQWAEIIEPKECEPEKGVQEYPIISEFESWLEFRSISQDNLSNRMWIQNADIFAKEWAQKNQDENLVSFGNYLLSKEREERVEEELRSSVHHSDLHNWKEAGK